MFLNEDKKEFHMLTPEQRSIIVEAWIKGQVEIYYREGGVWIQMPTSYNPLGFHIYRAKTPKPSINWEHVHPDYKYLVRTGAGDLLLCTVEPKWHHQQARWIIGGIARYCDHFASAKLGTCKTEDSLVERE